jgi:hypothetical protein
VTPLRVHQLVSLGSNGNEGQCGQFLDPGGREKGSSYSHIIVSRVWGFHGSDYEKWRLLEYENTVRISPETHYVSATEPSLLMLCTI